MSSFSISAGIATCLAIRKSVLSPSKPLSTLAASAGSQVLTALSVSFPAEIESSTKNTIREETSCLSVCSRSSCRSLEVFSFPETGNGKVY